MILSLETQARLFLLTIAIGAGLGVLYDCIRIFRCIIVHKRLWIQLEDGIYWLAAVFLTFSIMLYANNGEMRFFLLLGMLGGMLIYFLTLSRLIMSVSSVIIDVVKRIVKLFLTILFTPFRLVYLLFRTPLQKFGYFCDKNTRKVLQRYKSYVKIKKSRLSRDWRTVQKKCVKRFKGIKHGKGEEKKKTE